MMPVLLFPQFDPVIVQIGPFGIRWYALAYIAGLVLGWRLLRYLVRQAPRDLAPGRIALGLQQGGDVVEDDDEADVAVLARQRRAGAHQGAPAASAVQVELFAPLLAPGGATTASSSTAIVPNSFSLLARKPG